MAHLIDKDALVVEIEKRKRRNVLNEGAFEEDIDILSFINTLEVKDFWKPADGDDLPEIDREVIAILDNGKIVFAHRPPEYWDGKNIITGEVTRNYPKTYGKGGWNIPNVKYWLDYNIDSIIKED